MRNPFSRWLVGRDNESGKSGRAQTRDAWENPFALALQGYQPLKFNLDLYDLMREAVPLLDVAVIKLVRLIGDFELTAAEPGVQRLLSDFKSGVRVNHFSSGLNTWVDQLCDSALAKGMGFGELVPAEMLDDVERLKIARANDFRFVERNGRLLLGQAREGEFNVLPFANQDFIYYLSFDQRDGHPQGYSLFYSLPFVVKLFLRIQQAIENQVWRVGDPTFLVTVQGGRGGDFGRVKKAAEDLQNDITEVFRARRRGSVRDVAAAVPEGASIDVKILGGQDTILNLQVPVHTAQEEIITKTGLPPFMFGLYKWTTTERMSNNQNDMIVANINAYRTKIDPIIRRVVDTFLILRGEAGANWKLEWKEVNLLDKTEQARARLLNATVLDKELNAYQRMFEMGMIDDEEFVSLVRNGGFLPKKRVKGVKRAAGLLQVIAEGDERNGTVRGARRLLGVEN